jgi:hypothetical protein
MGAAATTANGKNGLGKNGRWPKCGGTTIGGVTIGRPPPTTKRPPPPTTTRPLFATTAPPLAPPTTLRDRWAKAGDGIDATLARINAVATIRPFLAIEYLSSF